MKHYKTPDLTILVESVGMALQTSGEADGGDTNFKFDDDIWGRQ